MLWLYRKKKIVCIRKLIHLVCKSTVFCQFFKEINEENVWMIMKYAIKTVFDNYQACFHFELAQHGHVVELNG